MKYLRTQNVTVQSPGGRTLFQDLEMMIEGERVAVVGRNGVGKSTLLDILVGSSRPLKGRIERCGSIQIVRQSLDKREEEPLSPGEQRLQRLMAAFAARPDFLLLDEPTQDLDKSGVNWLRSAVKATQSSLLVVTHDRALLRCFDIFFVVEESGSRIITGGLDKLLLTLNRERRDANRKYASQLAQLIRKEEHNEKIRLRRARKRAGGRVRELDRCPARACLNAKRGYAQVYQGKREGVRKQRIEEARLLTKAARRALTVELPLILPSRAVGPEPRTPIIRTRGVRTARGGAVKLPDKDLVLSHERIAVVGANGSGKSTLLRILVGDLKPDDGELRVDFPKVGYVAQHAENWKLDASLMTFLSTHSSVPGPNEAVELVLAHRFPLALAGRPMATLSPGERTRAALIALLHRTPSIELLALDEPTAQLDLAGLDALERALKAWQGGLLLISHDDDLLDAVGIERRIELKRD